MQRIRNAEAEAEEVGRRAEAARKKLVAESHEAAERMLDEMRAGAREEEKQLIADAAGAARADAEKLAAESRTNVESVRALGEQRVEAGIERVLKAMAARA
jgi:hypothetical protein